jgi:hypothetical protein
MTTAAALRHGFRTVRRAPALLLAEITWRWTFAVLALVLCVITFSVYLDSLRVSDAELGMLRSGRPFLAAEAVLSIVQGSGPRLLRAAAILLPALAILWVFAAAVGRALTLSVLARGAGAGKPPAFASILALTSLRLLVALAGVAAFFAAVVLIGFLAPAGELAAGASYYLAALVLLAAVLVLCIWGLLNWFLSLAPMFAAAGNSTAGALAAALALFQRRASELLGLTSLFALLHLAAFLAAFSVTAFALATAQGSPVASGVAVCGVALVYFAFVDFLYIARLAAWVQVADQDRTPAAEQVIS